MQAHVHTLGSRIDRLLEALWQAGGTDLLLSVGLPPMLRVDGRLSPAVALPSGSAGGTLDGLRLATFR